MVDIPEWLNYGAFGLLTVTLVVVGRFIYVQWTRVDEERTRSSEFNRKLAERSMDSWESIVRENTTTNQRLASSMEQLCDAVKNGAAQDRTEHKEIMREVLRNKRDGTQ